MAAQVGTTTAGPSLTHTLLEVVGIVIGAALTLPTLLGVGAPDPTLAAAGTALIGGGVTGFLHDLSA